VDSEVSNHMTIHGKWFRNIKDLKTPGFVEISDDTTLRPMCFKPWLARGDPLT
jgi:hypothetical protein